MSIYVTKMDGSKELYNEDKIISSASRVGVPSDMQHAMLDAIRTKLYDGINTSEIYKHITDYLAATPKSYLAIKYNLKLALSQLGPSGYPFEKYVALLLTAVGYQTLTNQIIQGSCVSHEIDVIATKDNYKYFIEAKFHKSPNQKTDVRVTLYIKARYDDILSALTDKNASAWIITNTRFSSEAIKYAKCQNIKVTSWGYPQNEGIMDLIEKTKLFPITIMDDLSADDRKRLLTNGVITCQQLLDPKYQDLVPKKFLKLHTDQLKDLCSAAS